VIHILVPVLNLGALGYMLVASPLWGSAVAYGTFKTLDYSLFRAAKELLYVPLPFDARYRAKEVIDVLGNRVSKGMASLGV
jgi:AAA family ATP:ADP antiporter